MAKRDEISVNVSALEEAESELANLSAMLRNRRFQVSFQKSEGVMMDAFVEQEKLLKQYGAALLQLVDATESAVRRTRVQFVAADQEIADMFHE